MVRDIVRSRILLARPSRPATADDLAIGADLADTLAAHSDGCVGMAANMIGEQVRVIAVLDRHGRPRVMYNPSIVWHEGPYQTEEGCLCLEGTRPASRWRRIAVKYQDSSMQTRTGRFNGIEAEAIQHEIDHCDGVVI